MITIQSTAVCRNGHRRVKAGRGQSVEPKIPGNVHVLDPELLIHPCPCGAAPRTGRLEVIR